MSAFSVPKEGQIYKSLTVGGHDFELKYGYYESHERELCPPVVIFPDLHRTPRYSPEGYPLVTQIQDPCRHYKEQSQAGEHWCGDCFYFTGEHREIGICRCPAHRLTVEGGK